MTKKEYLDKFIKKMREDLEYADYTAMCSDKGYSI